MAIKVLYPDAVDTDPGDEAVALVGAPTKDAAVADFASLPDDDEGYLQFNSSIGDTSIRFTLDNMPDLVEVSSISLVSRMRNWGSFTVDHQPFIVVAGVRYDGAVRTLGAGSLYATFTDTWATNPATGLPWSQADLTALIVGHEQKLNATETARLTQLHVAVDYVAGAALSPAALEVGSRILRFLRRDLILPEIAGPLTWADAELLEDLAYSNVAYPDVRGAGKGSQLWERALLRALSLTIDLDRLTCSRKTFDLLGYLCHFWDSGASEAAASAAAPSAARLNVGVLRFFERGSKAWVENAAAAVQGGAQLIEVGADVEKIELAGNLIEPAAQNDLLYSAFSAGAFTGWTIDGNVVPDTGDLLWHPTVSLQSARFARVGTANCRLHQTTAAYSGGEHLTFSGWHKDHTGTGLGWSAQRSTDGFFWNDTTESWQAAFVMNTFPIVSVPERHHSRPIVLSAGAQTVTVVLFAELAADQENQVYAVQLEEGRYPTSQIFTAAAVAPRQADVLRIQNDAGITSWFYDQGTAGVTWTPEMDSDPTIVEDSVLLNTSRPEGEGGEDLWWDRVFYRPSTGLMCFERRIDEVSYLATKAVTLVRGQPVRVVARATGWAGELGLPPNTLSIFVDGVKGTDAEAPAQAPNGPWLDIGSADEFGTMKFFAGGHLRDINIIPQVLPDEAIPDWR
jgi:hypothetical protein